MAEYALLGLALGVLAYTYARPASDKDLYRSYDKDTSTHAHVAAPQDGGLYEKASLDVHDARLRAGASSHLRHLDLP